LDRGLTHVAFTVGDLEASIAFYHSYARMGVVHQRADAEHGTRVAWISDGTRPFVIVLIESASRVPGAGLVPKVVSQLLPPFSHLGVACETREEVDAACSRAADEGILEIAPRDMGPPVGYLGLIRDPDGHHLEVSYGQDVGLTVAAETTGP
jgi:catechol 2,3-dioxygenase-like lactoylglutathione lyase family enzyme